MNVFTTRESLQQALNEERLKGKTIGFVPTMGALHEGHLALVNQALNTTGKVVVSIFVNPTQFNNSSDLTAYPRMLDHDVELLKTVGDVLVFAPDVADVYPKDDEYEELDLEGLDHVLEGKYRPGHFQGVVHVLRNFFRIIQPDKAFFGLKDFQQVAVVRLMTRKFKFQTEIVACPTLREPSGLALSSRNLRLTETQKNDALIIYKTLEFLKSSREKFDSPASARAAAVDFFNKGNLELEYLEIVDGNTLQSLDKTWSEYSVCCIAAQCGDVRLIDNNEIF